MEKMTLCDTHAHRNYPLEDYKVCRILQMPQHKACQDAFPFSLGIHPMEEDGFQRFEEIRECPNLQNWKAVGECGLDRRSSVPFLLQKKLFLQHAELSERLKKPLILHCVRYVPEIQKIKREFQPVQPWIFHGFRGNERKAMELVENGFTLSFGEGLLKDAGNMADFFQLLPEESILLETDNSDNALLLPQLYALAAQMRQLDILTFSQKILANYNRLFA